MMGHKICFYEEMLIIIPKLSLLLLLIWSPDSCSVKKALSGTGHTWLAALTPAFVRIPKWIMALGGNKFY